MLVLFNSTTHIDHGRLERTWPFFVTMPEDSRWPKRLSTRKRCLKSSFRIMLSAAAISRRRSFATRCSCRLRASDFKHLLHLARLHASSSRQKARWQSVKQTCQQRAAIIVQLSCVICAQLDQSRPQKEERTRCTMHSGPECHPIGPACCAASCVLTP
jgi:hypothetical protein